MFMREVIFYTLFKHLIKQEAGGGCFLLLFFAQALCFVKSHWQQPEAKAKTSEEAERLFVF